MKVETIEAFPIRIKAQENLKGGTFSYSHYQTVLVRAMADGVEGWGEAMTRFDPVATALLVRYLSKGLVGRDHDDVEAAWRLAWRELRLRGHTRGTDVEALSGIEIALQDCMGKLRRRPLGALFSRSPAKEVLVFAGSLYESRGPLEGQVERAKQSGTMGAKIKIGFGVDRDRSTLSAARKVWPDGMLVADANGAYDAVTAAKACAAFSNFNLGWFEEPVVSDDIEGYRLLKNSKIRIGAGESWFVGDFEEPLQECLVGVVEPSVSRCGGFWVESEVATKASSRGIAFSPMTGMNSAISLAASLHLASVHPSLGVEYNPFINPLLTEFAYGLGEPSKGRITVPVGDGLGLEVDKGSVKKHISQ